MTSSLKARDHGCRGSHRRLNLLVAFALLLLSGGTAPAWQQYRYLEEPENTASRPRVKYLAIDVEAEQSAQQSTVGVQSRYERLYIAPSVGISWDYLIYHPDLFNFSLLAEPGYSWQESGPPGGLSKQTDAVVNGTFNGRLLQLKPYATTIFANSVHENHQYDFFNSVTEDSQAFGFLTGYREGPIPVTIGLQKTIRDTTGFSYDTTSDQLTLDLHARNERHNQDFTDFSYQFSQYDSTTTDSLQTFKETSDFHYLTVTDTENFHKSVLTSTLLFDLSESSATTSDDLNLRLDYSVEHTPNLRSMYDYSFSYFSTDGGDGVQNTARAGLQHQLYESLTSYGDLHAANANSSFSGSTLDLVSAGTTVALTYTKRLGTWGRLSISDSATYDLTDQQTSGSVLLIPKESHALPRGQWVRLNQPRDIAIIGVTTDAAHGEILLTENVDYFVDRSRDPWQLQRNPFSVILTDSNNVVLVTYTVQANPSGTFSTFSDQAQIRLDLWNGMLGLYARYSFSENYTNSPGFVLENVDEFQAGVDFYNRGLRLSANFTDRESSLFSYSSYSLTENYTPALSRYWSIGLNLNQRWNFYPANEGSGTSAYQVDFYDVIGRASWHPLSAVDWNIEAGYEIQRGPGVDQNLAVARGYFNWFIGKLEIHLGYEYQNQKYTAETREHNFAFLRARRNL